METDVQDLKEHLNRIRPSVRLDLLPFFEKLIDYLQLLERRIEQLETSVYNND